MLDFPDVAIGAIAAAVIAGLVSLIGLIISKEQKTSEFRQAWIDALRNEVSALTSHAMAIQGFQELQGFPIEPPQDAWKIARAEYFGINQAVARIKLRLNQKEEPSRAILRTIDEVESVTNSAQPIQSANINPVLRRLVEETNTVLKQEWERVKRGELIYRVAKFLSVVVVLFFVALILWSISSQPLPNVNS